MPRALPAFFFCFCSAFVLGCGKSSRAASGLELGGTGVDACDGYVARAAACARKLPPDLRAANEAAVGAARDILEERAAATSAGDGADPKAALAAACKQMAAALAERALCN